MDGINGRKYGNAGSNILLIHAQGTSMQSYEHIAKRLSKTMQVWLVDCPGHGKSIHDSSVYKLSRCGELISQWADENINAEFTVLGHSSGGLIAAYIAANNPKCIRVILEDPPFFACEGDNRYGTFNYKDLSSVCHSYIESGENSDFVLYYFKNQYAWNFFPDKSREKARNSLVKMAENHRRKHPDADLKVMFWPCEMFRGMNGYDPNFGEAFYTDSFNDIGHVELLSKISVPALFLKAKTVLGADGTQNCALTDEQLDWVAECIDDCRVQRFDCGHGIHSEKPKEFLRCVTDFVL